MGSGGREDRNAVRVVCVFVSGGWGGGWRVRARVNLVFLSPRLTLPTVITVAISS